MPDQVEPITASAEETACWRVFLAVERLKLAGPCASRAEGFVHCCSAAVRSLTTLSSQRQPSAYGQQKEPGSSVEPAVSLTLSLPTGLQKSPT
jgi:hypothetical protein